MLLVVIIVLSFQVTKNSSSSRSVSTPAPTSQIQTSMFDDESKEHFRFAIDTEITIHYSTNFSSEAYVNKSVILRQIQQLIESEDLQQSFLIDLEWSIEMNTADMSQRTLNLYITIDTDSEEDLALIIMYCNTEEFQQSLKNIAEQSDEEIIVWQVEVVFVTYVDNEETQVDW
eukprot:CAMPEP_0197026336 /NCGR_PEP_ID=MMETSP1384-20130603/6447_1 /TAXON_ID=29189 /ORGANISM="Ammonia sp." /LENGTH=172 /DNA_ID=CAMNT_0042454981 /DNA_START=42 /DNA_END=557 /DNA_ORIENTATION=-